MFKLQAHLGCSDICCFSDFQTHGNQLEIWPRCRVLTVGTVSLKVTVRTSPRVPVLRVELSLSEYEAVQVWCSDSANREQLIRPSAKVGWGGAFWTRGRARAKAQNSHVEGMCCQRLSGDQRGWDPRHMEECSRTQVLETKSGRKVWMEKSLDYDPKT